MSDDHCEHDYAEPQFPDGAIVRDIPIVNRKGLHARATAKFVQCVEKFDAEIMVSRCGETVGGTSIMGILTLGAGMGSIITVAATGRQADEALTALQALVADKFGEDEPNFAICSSARKRLDEIRLLQRQRPVQRHEPRTLRSIVPGLYVLTRPILIKIYERRGGEVDGKCTQSNRRDDGRPQPFQSVTYCLSQSGTRSDFSRANRD